MPLRTRPRRASAWVVLAVRNVRSRCPVVRPEACASRHARAGASRQSPLLPPCFHRSEPPSPAARWGKIPTLAAACPAPRVRVERADPGEDTTCARCWQGTNELFGSTVKYATKAVRRVRGFRNKSPRSLDSFRPRLLTECDKKQFCNSYFTRHSSRSGLAESGRERRRGTGLRCREATRAGGPRRQLHRTSRAAHTTFGARTGR